MSKTNRTLSQWEVAMVNTVVWGLVGLVVGVVRVLAGW